jgi:hypothetical protein
MEDSSDLWREYRRAQQQRRTDRLPKRTAEILALRGKGVNVVQLTPYQFRLDGVIDLYPIHRRFHHLKTGQRGHYRTALAVAVWAIRGAKDGEVWITDHGDEPGTT